MTNFSLTDPTVLSEGADWANKINALDRWKEIGALGKNICRDVYTKAGKIVPASLFAAGENYGKILDDAFTDYELKFIDLVNVFKTKIGVDPTDETLATDKDGNNIVVDGHTIPEWKHFINRKISDDITLKDVPDNHGLLFLIYKAELFREITDKGITDLIKWGAIKPDGGREFIATSHGYQFTYKVDTNKLTEYKNAKTTIANAETHLGLNPGDLTTITTNAVYNMNGKTLTQLLTPHTCPPCALTHCPSAHADYNTIKGESAEYQRIHTKLSGKVSDSELDNLLNQTPNCSHTDYDAIKQERDDLKQQKDNYSTEKQQAIQNKEKEIINKIITDLGLATERERERERERALEAIITEIKSKLTPPTCDKCPGKDSKISELQEQINNLKTPKTLKDLPISKGIKQEVIKVSQELGLTAQSCAKLEKATSYQELSSWQKQAFQERLEQETSDKNSANSLNWALGILTLGSLLALAWMIMKQNKGILPELDKEKKE